MPKLHLFPFLCYAKKLKLGMKLISNTIPKLNLSSCNIRAIMFSYMDYTVH